MKELHAYLQKFKSAHSEHFLLSTHFNIAEKISERLKDKSFDERLDTERSMMEGHDTERCEEYIEAAIAKQMSLPLLMRLLGLMSLTTGIRSKKVEQWKRDILQTYGYHVLFTLNNLERVGLLSSNKKSSAYSAVKKQLRLVQGEKEGGRGVGGKGGGGGAGGEDISYVYEGVAPMIVRLIEGAMRPGWKRMDEIMAMIPGNGFEYRQDGQQETVPIGHTQAHAASSGGGAGGRDSGGGLRGFFGKRRTHGGATDEAAPSSAAHPSAAGGGGGTADGEGGEGGESVIKKKPVVMAMFIGGCTYAEIAALRSLSERADHDYEYVIATTKVINGSSLCSSLQETVLDPDVEKVGQPRRTPSDADRAHPALTPSNDNSPHSVSPSCAVRAEVQAQHLPAPRRVIRPSAAPACPVLLCPLPPLPHPFTVPYMRLVSPIARAPCLSPLCLLTAPL